MTTPNDSAENNLPKGYTPKKGRPTPKRDEVERARGVRRGGSTKIQTPQERKAHEKALKESMTKAEWKDYKRKQREERSAESRRIQAAMDRGDEKYLQPRDQGAVRGFVRDWVDSRRFFMQLVMPVALVLLVILFIGQSYPEIAAGASMVSMVIITIFFIEGIITGIRVNKAVRQKFPDSSEHGLGLGFYACSRASQLRKLRTPKPRVDVGQSV
ncbi:DUF3043 domain-containing protein [Corynebacterium sp. H128]|uniref:DUF3043 domain-containing protein n=1 Tax=unclassified Corynebacterium TaxID=2624378 RepID=UPI0030A71724